MYNTIGKKRLKRFMAIAILTGIAIPTCIVIVKNTTTYYTTRVQRFFTPKQVSCIIHNIFSQTLQSEIEAYSTLALTQRSLVNTDQRDFLIQLKEEFPVIKNIEWKFLTSQTLQVTIYGTKPHCRVNDTFILGDQQTLLSIDSFNDSDITKLPNITIRSIPSIRDCRRSIGTNGEQKQHQKISKQAYAFIHKIPAKIWADYTITYHGPSIINLIPKQSLCACKIIADTKSFFDEKKWSSLNPIINDLATQKLITQKMLQAKKTVLTLDMRLKNRIIVKFFQQSLRGRGS